MYTSSNKKRCACERREPSLLSLHASHTMQPASTPALELAHRLASEGEDFYEEANLEAAAQRFEAAAEQYVRATLCTGDTESLQSLRLLAISHTQRAHEIVCRMRLHDAQLADPRFTPSGGRSWAKAEAGGTSVEAGGAEASTALLPRLGSQLISSLEALHFGAEELLCIEMLMPTVSASSMRGSQLGGGASGAGGGLLDSFYVVPSQPGMLNHGRGVGALGGSVAGSEPGDCLPAGASRETGGHASLQALQAPHTQRAAALTAENLRLTRENATLRQQGAEMHAALGKVQRRAAEQLRLSKKALSALQEVQAAPRPQLPASSAQEIADLRSQLEAAHAVRRQQAEQVRKYEQRWAQLKASARRKQAQQTQQALHKGALGGSPLAASGGGGASCP